MKKIRYIMLVAGGTGGHLFPAIAASEKLKKSGITTKLITDKRGNKFLSSDYNPYIVDIYIKPGLIGKITAILQLFLGVIKSLYIYLRTPPSLVIGFGGYPAFAPLLAAKIIGLPIVIFEPNCFLGKVNKFFARDARLIGLAFEGTKNLPDNIQQKSIVTGDLIRQKIKDISKSPSTSRGNNELRILIFGGSQGASIFSDIVPKAVAELASSDPKLKISIIQQARKAEQESLIDRYNSLGIEHQIAEFFHDMPELYSKTDIAICRAGAGTVAELTTAKIPAIYIPLPNAADDHQFYNANEISKNGGSWCLRQQDATTTKIANLLQQAATTKGLISQMQQHLGHRKTSGARILATACLKLIT